MFYLRYFLIFLVLICLAVSGLSKTDVELHAYAVLNNFRHSDLTPAQGADSQQVLELLRNIASGKVKNIGTASYDGSEARVVLLRLGDDLTIQNTVNIYQSEFPKYGPNGLLVDVMEESKQPKLIPYLTKDFDLQEDTALLGSTNGKEGVSYSPRSLFSGIVCGRIIRASDEFSPELKAWTWKMHRMLGTQREQCRETWRVWWRENQKLFAEGKYKEVKPVELPSPTRPVVTPQPPIAPSTPTPSPTPSTTPSPTPQASPTKVEVPQPKEKPSNITLLYSLAAIIFGGIGFVFYRSRKR